MTTIDAHGASIPALGLGTWQLDDREAERMVDYALQVGYRHIDTAQMYENEVGVGRGIRAGPVPREEIFLVTKVSPGRLAADVLPASVDESLTRLGTDYIDLLLIHWPSRNVPLTETLGALARVRASGRARHIGVSNFPSAMMERARASSSAPVVANQVEYHPFLDQTAVLGAGRAAGMAVIAYSPLAKGRVPRDGVLREIGRAHGKTAAQVSLRWLLQQESVGAIPKTSDPRRCEENLRIFDFELAEEEMDRIHGLAEPGGRIIDPPGVAPEWD